MNPNFCFKCHHSQLAHTVYTHKKDVGNCVAANCNCVAFAPIPEYLSCGSCIHAHRFHGNTGRCIVSDCECTDFIIPQQIQDKTKRPVPSLFWKKISTHLSEYDVPELNVKFHLIHLNTSLDLRLKSYNIGHFQDWKKISNVGEANSLIFRFLLNRVKATSKAIGFLENNKGPYPHLSWRQITNFRESCHRLELTEFGGIYWVNERIDGLALTREIDGTARQLILPICKHESDIDRLIFNDIKSSLRKTIQRLGLLNVKGSNGKGNESITQENQKWYGSKDERGDRGLFDPP